MFEIGFAELFLLGVIALLVVGPDRLPGLARTVGVWVGKAQRLVGQVRADIEREVRAEEIRKAAKEYSPTGVLSDMRKEVEDLASEVSRPVDLDANEGGAGKPDGSDPPPGGRAAAAATAGAGSEAAAAAKAGGRAGQSEAGAATDEPEPVDPAAGGASEPKAPAAEASGGVSGAGRAADPEAAVAPGSSPPGPRRAEPPSSEPEGGEKRGCGGAAGASGSGPEAEGSDSGPGAARPAELSNGRRENAAAPTVTEGARTRRVEPDERTAAP